MDEQKDRAIHRKLILKVKFWHFLTPPHYTNSQISIISIGYVDFHTAGSDTIFSHIYLVGKSYHTKQKDGYSLPTNDPTNNHINWIWMSENIGL